MGMDGWSYRMKRRNEKIVEVAGVVDDMRKVEG